MSGIVTINIHLYIKTILLQPDNKQLIDKAYSIVGNEDNHYLRAKKVFDWIVSQNWKEMKTGNEEDALSVLKTYKTACGGRANLFVALCRALGIPD
ncbi:MAG: transglutaminase-like domain-containing protein [Desulfovermiculus sp.]|nr:transglutaminase-like domain-containing protein [Desulfovermiculus sp.]